MTKELSPATLALYKAIIKYKLVHDGHSPPLRELGEMVGQNSTSMISYYLKKLEDAQLIMRGPATKDATTCGVIHVIGAKWLPPTNGDGNEKEA